MNEIEHFDAHIGICSNKTVHLRKYSSLFCSNCSEHIDFKITNEEFEKMEKSLPEKTMSGWEVSKPYVVGIGIIMLGVFISLLTLSLSIKYLF